MDKKAELIPGSINMDLLTPMNLEYYLTEFIPEDVNDMELSGKRHYGIEIVKKVDGMKDEIQSVRSLSCDIEYTKAIFAKIVDNTVTPVCMFEILDDIVGI
jgi:hypothetical protein